MKRILEEGIKKRGLKGSLGKMKIEDLIKD